MDLDTLAGMINRRFDSVEGDLKGIKTDVGGLKVDVGILKSDMEDVRSRLRSVERNVEYIHDHMVFQDPFEDISARVKYLEEKMGIDSGK